jgi:DNA-binding CsgD family transcriptional regulator
VPATCKVNPTGRPPSSFSWLSPVANASTGPPHSLATVSDRPYDRANGGVRYRSNERLLCCGAKREREVLQDIRDIKYVEAFSRLVFDLHRAALEAPMERFQEEALDLLSEHVSFDSAWWGMSATAIRAFDVHASYTYKLPANFGEVWETVRHDPKMIRMVSKGPGYTLNCELPEFFADAPQIRAVTEALGLRQLLFTFDLNRNVNILTFLVLYRKDKDRRFSEEERLFTQLVVPHLFACWSYNRITQISQLRMSRMDLGFLVALADRKGVVHDAAPGFAGLMREEWPDWRSPSLPPALIRLCQRQSSSFTGDRLVVKASGVRDWVLLLVSKRAPADFLSNQERAIASAFAKGESYKEIAHRLAISPATVRHHLRRIYEKLEISDKAQLAQLMLL